MARLLLIAFTLAGCYSPQLADCVDTCGTSRICPEGLTCSDGFCRTEGATGACEVPIDAAPDQATDAALDAAIDGPPVGACPPVPVLQGCAPVGPTPVMPYCHATCQAATGTEALGFSEGTWHAAVIEDQVELDVASDLLPGQLVWIGLSQPLAQASPAAAWRWSTGIAVTFTAWGGAQPDDGDMVENSTEQCGYLAGGAWFDEPCSASHVYMIEPF